MADFPALDVVELPADAVEVARVLDAWGIKGWIKLLPHSAQPEALFSSKRWYVLPKPGLRPDFDLGANRAYLLPVREAKDHADAVVACSTELPDRQAAEALKGARVFVPRSSFPTPDPDEYYWVDLIGLDVINREGLHLGRVVDLLATGPQTVLVLQQPATGETDKAVERMIPFVSNFVDQVDLSARCIRVDWQPDY